MILQVYDTPLGELVHADLYRLGDSSEAEVLGLDELHGVLVVEWPERAWEALPSARLDVRLDIVGDSRVARLSASHPRLVHLEAVSA